jgi:uncharacterized protein (DUF427 family)
MADSNAFSPAEIVAAAIDYSGTRQYWDFSVPDQIASLYRYLNWTYREVYNAIIDIDKDYFHSRRVTDCEANQTEYPLEKVI